jgi:hypothetical protein
LTFGVGVEFPSQGSSAVANGSGDNQISVASGPGAPQLSAAFVPGASQFSTANDHLFILFSSLQLYHFFHSRTVHLNIVKFFIYRLMHKRIDLKGVLKFTLKMLRHVSV